jgi:hypothetical protein
MRRIVAILAAVCLTAVPMLAGGNSAPVQTRTSPTATSSTSTTLGSERADLDAVTIPRLLSYQGKLTDTLGQPVPNGNYTMMFLLYTVPSGGASFWSESQSVTTKSGLFSVLLGSVTPIDSVPSAGAVYLGMNVNSGAELTPRIRIGSSAYAYLSGRAASADLLQGKDTTGFVRTGQANSVTSPMIADAAIAAADLSQMGASSGQVMKWNGSAWVPGNDSVGQSSGGTVTSVSQATGVVCSPNPITSTGTVGFDQTYGDGRYERVANKNVASGYCGLDGSTKVPNARLYTGTGNGLDADLLDGNHSTAFAPASGSANYIQNQNAAYQTANWRIAGQGRDSLTSGSYAAALYGTATGSNYGVVGVGVDFPGVQAKCTGQYGALEGINYYASNSGFSAGVAGHGFGGSAGAFGVYGDGDNIGVYGTSSNHPGVYGTSSNSYGVEGVSSSNFGAYDSSSSSYGAYGVGTIGVYGKGTSYYGVYGTSASSAYPGVYGYSSTYWGGMGYRGSSQSGSDYGYGYTLGGLRGTTYWGDTFTFGTAGYTYGDYRRTGGAFGADYYGDNWGALGYKNSSGNWYGGYGTSGWTSGSGLSSHRATGIGCGYGGGLMGGWLKGTYYGATVSGDRYALYTKGNNYTTGYSVVMQNTGGKREASYVPTSTTVDIYTSGVSEMKGGQASVTFPASFASMVSKDVPVVVTATPMGPAPIYLSSSDNKGFTVSAVDSKASVKFSWIAVGRRAGYEKNPDVPAELCRTDFDSKMDGVMYNENDLQHSAQPVWFDGTQLRFDNPPEEARPPKPAQPVNVGLQAPPQAPTPVAPASDQSTSTASSGTTAPVLNPSSTQSTGAEK